MIVQTSVKTVRSIGVKVLASMWRSMTAGIRFRSPFTSITARTETSSPNAWSTGGIGAVRRVRSGIRESATDNRGRRAHAVVLPLKARSRPSPVLKMITA